MRSFFSNSMSILNCPRCGDSSPKSWNLPAWVAGRNPVGIRLCIAIAPCAGRRISHLGTTTPVDARIHRAPVSAPSSAQVPTRYDRYQERASDRGGRSIGDVQVWTRAVNWPAGRSRESGRICTNPAGMAHQSSLADEDASSGTRGEPFSWEQEAPAQGNLRPGSIGLALPGVAPANSSTLQVQKRPFAPIGPCLM